MSSDRITKLLDALKSRPDDPFLLYALALETKSAGDAAAAERYFAEVRSRFPGYVPLYLLYGGFEQERGNLEAACTLYREGMQQAKLAGDAHALKELTAALQMAEDLA